MKLEYIVCGEQRSLLGLIQGLLPLKGLEAFGKGTWLIFLEPLLSSPSTSMLMTHTEARF